MSRFKDKVYLITGATSGIGRDTALALAREGAKVAFTGRREERGRELEKEIKDAGGVGLYIKADSASEQDTKHAVELTVKTFGGLHGAFNNAAIEGEFVSYLEASYDTYRKVFDTNVWGILANLKHEIPAILATVGPNGGGSVVNNSSVAGLLGFPNASVYVGSKHAVSGITRTVALELAQQGVRVNAIAPAVIETEMSQRAFGDDPELRASLAAMHPIGRIGQPREITGPVLWLLSDESSFVTGQVIPADGGLTAQ